jgi:hypothetical protein
MTSGALLVTSVSKYLRRILSTNIGSAIRRPTMSAKVISAVQGLVNIFLNIVYLRKKIPTIKWAVKNIA